MNLIEIPMMITNRVVMRFKYSLLLKDCSKRLCDVITSVAETDGKVNMTE